MDDRTDAQKQAQRDQWKYNLTNHKPHPNAEKRMNGLMQAAIAMADAIINMCPAGREQSLALTSLEQMKMYAIAAIARFETMDNPKFAAARATDDQQVTTATASPGIINSTAPCYDDCGFRSRCSNSA